jgi:hypothetical protein
LATQAAADLTHALLYPQPASLFCKVGDEQTKALKRLANIFEGAKRRKSKVVVTPTNGVENTAPQRVQTTVSPPRVANTTAQLMSPQRNTSAHSTPNSHRRQKTPARRAVTPQTPHVMMQRSARQKHNLSQDMMAETISQENHCFSISAHPKTQNSKIRSSNNKVIILLEMANAVICPETGKSLKHQELITTLRYKIKWMRSTANEINRLYNTNTIRFICRSNIPKGRKVTYGSFVVDIKDHKEEKERTRLTVGGNQIEYPGDNSTQTAGLTTAKIIINSVISTLVAKFLVIDIKNFYLNTPLGRFEYIVINLPSLPQENRKVRSDRTITGRKSIHRNSERHVRITTGRQPRQRIVTAQSSQGWLPAQHTHGRWTHVTRTISFSLVVDDFGVKYVGREHAEHLMACIKKNYNVSSDWNGGA